MSFILYIQSRQDENINNVILKNEDVATVAARGNRDRCRLILYPDAIVCCNLKTKLLARYFSLEIETRKNDSFLFPSPKYALLWFIPIFDLHWTVPQSSSDDNPDTGGKLFFIDMFFDNFLLF